jgi:tetratricopeptide (TPR) repeat protein
LTLDRVSRLPVLFVVTFRPEFQHTWSGQPQVTMLALNQLTGRDSAALVEQLAGGPGISRKTVDAIVERTDGVPLFVEELTKAVLEGGDRTDALAASPSPMVVIPATLHASLIARFDRLGPLAKEVGQIGAVVGREFGYELIERLAERSGGELQAGLDLLTAAGLLFCRGAAPQSSYLFKHALVQDAAYGTLLRARRQELHTRVAAVLEQHFADLIDRQPELLAHHLTAAGDTERAADQWLKAGRYAAARSAHREAIGHFVHGLATLAALPEGPSRAGREIELQLARGLSLFTVEGFISTEAAQAYTRARELADQWGDARQNFMAVYGQWQSTAGAGRVLAGRSLSEQLLKLTVDDADSGLRLQAHHSAWTTCLFAGELAAGREHAAAGRRLYDPERHRSHRLLYGAHDPGVCAGNMAARIDWMLGYPEKALTLSSETLALAELTGHPWSLEQALLYSAVLHLDRGEPEMALQRLEAGETLALEQRLGFFWEPPLLRGAIMIARRAFDEAVAPLREALAGQTSATTRPYGLTLLSEALVQRGNPDAALSKAREALELQGQSGQRQWEAETRRVEGIALFSLNRLEEGQTALEEALRVARKQEAKSYARGDEPRPALGRAGAAGRSA